MSTCSIKKNSIKARGKFITVEGSEGVGKSTNIVFIQDWFAKQNIELLVTREPGGTPLAEEIRSLLLGKREESVDETAELLLMFAARSQHLHQHILPALERGVWVLCDRFTDSTYAYQGAGRNVNQAVIQQLETLVQGDIQPDLTLHLDIDVELGLARANKRAALDRFESENLAFFHRVRAAYQQRAKQFPQRFVTIDASGTPEQVRDEIADALSLFLSNIALN